MSGDHIVPNLDPLPPDHSAAHTSQAGFQAILGPGRYGAHISQARAAQRQAFIERQVWLQSPVSVWLVNRVLDHKALGRFELLGAAAEDWQKLYAPRSTTVVEISSLDQAPALIAAKIAYLADPVEIRCQIAPQVKTIPVIKAIIDRTGWTLVEARDWLKAARCAPAYLIMNTDLAEQALNTFRRLGMTVDLPPYQTS